MKDYKINEETLAIIPISKKKSIVYENHDCYVIEEKTSKIMDNNCEFNGSSISGRAKGTQKLTGIVYKAPIIVNEEKNTIFFPTSSPRLKDCSWINVNNINKIHQKEDKSLIEFYNNELIEINSSYYIIQNQYLKSLSLAKALENKKKN